MSTINHREGTSQLTVSRHIILQKFEDKEEILKKLEEKNRKVNKRITFDFSETTQVKKKTLFKILTEKEKYQPRTLYLTKVRNISSDKQNLSEFVSSRPVL
jgi:predicted transcriptional regulator